MWIKKFFFTFLIASMILSKQQAAAAYYESCEVCDYEGCGYSECRRSACMFIAFAWGVAIFAGMYAIILEDSKSTHSH